MTRANGADMTITYTALVDGIAELKPTYLVHPARGLGRRRLRRCPVIANPDLEGRWQEGHPLNEVDHAIVYTDGAAGYADYPELVPVP